MIEIEPISMKWYLSKLPMGLLLWIPFISFALIVPILGWIMLPVVPFFPFIYPFLDRAIKQTKNQKILKKAKEYEAIEIARKQLRTKGGV